MRRLTALLLTLSTLQAMAEPAPLGRLFLDPQQRARLDGQRLRNPAFLPHAEDQTTGQTFNGEVRRSDGRRTRWINGEVDMEGTAPGPGIPVGDTLHPATGERHSLIGNGRIIIRRQPSTP